LGRNRLGWSRLYESVGQSVRGEEQSRVGVRRVGARTLRPPTVQATFPAVGDRVYSHDHPSAFGHTVEKPALPVVRVDKNRGVISTPFVRWQFSISSFVGNSVSHRLTLVHVLFWLRDVGVLATWTLLAVI